MACNSTKNDNYTPEKLERLKSMVEKTGRDFSILVDEMRVVPKTNDIDEFFAFEEFVDEDTETVKVQLFHGTSNTCQNYIYRFKNDNTQKPLLGLPEPSLDQKVEEKLSLERQKWENQLLTEKLVKTEKDLKDAEEYIDILHEEVSALKKKTEGGGVWGELGGTLLSIVKTNPQVLSGIPLFKGLAGATPTAEQAAETEASFSRKEEQSEEDKQYLLFLKSLQASFDQSQFEDIIAILRKLSENPSQIPSVKDLLS